MSYEQCLFLPLVKVAEVSWKSSVVCLGSEEGPPRVNPYEMDLGIKLPYLNLPERANQGCALYTYLEQCLTEPRNLIAPCPSSVTSTSITSVFCIIRALVQLAGELGLVPNQSVNYIAL